MLAVVTAHSDVPSVRDKWMPRLALALLQLGAHPQAVRAAAALFEVYSGHGSGVAEVLQRLLFELLDLARGALPEGRMTTWQRETLLETCFDLIAVATRDIEIVTPGVRTRVLEWTSMGLELLPHARSPELFRSILEQYGSVATDMPSNCFLVVVLRSLVLGCEAMRADLSLATCLARHAYNAAKVWQGSNMKLHDALAELPIDRSVVLKFEAICNGVANGVGTHADVAGEFID